MCECNFCKLTARIKNVKVNGSSKQKNELINDLANLYWDTEGDLNYMQTIFDGSYLSSANILADRLDNAISKITPDHEKMSRLTLKLKEAIVKYNEEEFLNKLES